MVPPPNNPDEKTTGKKESGKKLNRSTKFSALKFSLNIETAKDARRYRDLLASLGFMLALALLEGSSDADDMSLLQQLWFFFEEVESEF